MMDGGTFTNFSARQITPLGTQGWEMDRRKWHTKLHVSAVLVHYSHSHSSPLLRHSQLSPLAHRSVIMTAALITCGILRVCRWWVPPDSRSSNLSSKGESGQLNSIWSTLLLMHYKNNKQVANNEPPALSHSHRRFGVHAVILFEAETVTLLKETNSHFRVRDHLNFPSNWSDDSDEVWERSEGKRAMGCVQLSRSLDAPMNSLEVN